MFRGLNRLLTAGVTSVCVSLGATSWGGTARAEEPTVQPADLFSPQMFPEAQYGMAVESAEDGPVARVVTTGARFLLDKQADTIRCAQRLAKDRDVTLLQLPEGTLQGMKLESSAGGYALFAGKGGRVRINGDSLLMVQPASDGPIVARITFPPDYRSEYRHNFNIFDPYGGVSFYEHGRCRNAQADWNGDRPQIRWDWRGGDVFWVGVSPPKPFDWHASVRERYVIYGSSIERYMYPSDLLITRWAALIKPTVLHLHCENAWENWQLSFVPKDEQEYLRTMRTAHEFGLKTTVYASPKHFLKGTAHEGDATSDVNDPASHGSNAGSNADEFLKQARRLIEDYETDGLFFDEMYCNHQVLATTYYLTRKSRELVGPDGPLVLHCTEDVMGDRPAGWMFGRTTCPTIHAYFSVIYKGEAVWDTQDPIYTRYILSTFNISNSLSVWGATDDRYNLDPQHLDWVVRHANTRLFLPESFFFTGQVDVFRDHYWPLIAADDLRAQIEPVMLTRISPPGKAATPDEISTPH